MQDTIALHTLRVTKAPSWQPEARSLACLKEEGVLKQQTGKSLSLAADLEFECLLKK